MSPCSKNDIMCYVQWPKPYYKRLPEPSDRKQNMRMGTTLSHVLFPLPGCKPYISKLPGKWIDGKDIGVKLFPMNVNLALSIITVQVNERPCTTLVDPGFNPISRKEGCGLVMERRLCACSGHWWSNQHLLWSQGCQYVVTVPSKLMF